MLLFTPWLPNWTQALLCSYLRRKWVHLRCLISKKTLLKVLSRIKSAHWVCCKCFWLLICKERLRCPWSRASVRATHLLHVCWSPACTPATNLLIDRLGETNTELLVTLQLHLKSCVFFSLAATSRTVLLFTSCHVCAINLFKPSCLLLRFVCSVRDSFATLLRARPQRFFSAIKLHFKVTKIRIFTTSSSVRFLKLLLNFWNLRN